MTAFEIISIICGVICIIFNCLIVQQKTPKRILITKLLCDIFSTLQYFFKYAFSGMAIGIIAIIRESIFLNKEKHAWARSNWWLILFLLLSLISPVLTWRDATSLFPMTASIISIYAFWLSHPLWTKILAYPIAICQISYAIRWMIPMGIAGEAIMIVSTTVGLVRYLKAKKALTQ